MNDTLIIRAIEKLNEAVMLLRTTLLERTFFDENADLGFLDSDLEEWDLGPGYTVRARNMFKNHHVYVDGNYVDKPLYKVRDLVELSESDVLKEPNIGRRTLEHMKVVLKEHGLHFGMRL